MTYDPPDVETDEDAVTERLLSNLVDTLDEYGWEPVEGAPEVALAEEIGRESTDTNLLTTTALATAWAGIGETVYELVPTAAAYATLPDVEITFTPVAPGPAGLADSTIPAGFTIVVDDGADGVAYQLLNDVTPTSTAPIHVSMQAVEPGAAGNIAVTTPVEAEIVTSTLAVASATVLTSGVGGLDDEPLEDYLPRLIDYVSLLRPGGVNGPDLAALARTVPVVHRALGLDLYDPADGSTDNERTATVVAIDDQGKPVLTAELAQTLESAREVNFVIHLAPPTYTPVAVAVHAYARRGATPSTVQAAVVASIAAALSPASWGSTAADPNAWTERPTLRTFDVVAAVLAVDDVAAVDTVTLNGSAGTVTVTLNGPAALPAPTDANTNPSTITVTIDELPT